MSKFDWAGLLIFSLVFVLFDFEVGTDVSSEESTISLCTGLIFILLCGCRFCQPTTSVKALNET